MERKSATTFIIRIAPVVLFVIMTATGITFSLYLIYSGANTTYMHAVAILFLALSLISGFFNIFTAYSYYRSSLYDEYIDRITKDLKPLKNYPTVAVAVPVYNEDVDLVKKNMKRLMDLKYPSSKIRFYLLDDSTNEKAQKELNAFSKQQGYIYVHRNTRSGFKAGALNNLMKLSREDYIAIFDYDEYLTNTNFLTDLLPYFDNKELSYVQTEKRYFKGTFFSDSVDLVGAFFFKFIQPSRALNNTAIFAGSCGIIKRSALKKIGGFPEYIVEDTFFSLESDMHSYKSIYVPKVYALGKPITTFTELAKQQWRYNYGGTQFLGYFINRLRNLKSNDRNLSTMSRIEYLTHGLGLNYVSVIVIMFTLVSILIVFSSLQIATITLTHLVQVKYLSSTLKILGISTFVLSILAPIALTKILFKSVKKGLMVSLLTFALAMIRTKAAISAALKLNPSHSWSRETINPNARIGIALSKSFTEVAFSSSLLILSIIAFVINNVSGSAWLLWYSLLYISTFLFFYKYG